MGRIFVAAGHGGLVEGRVDFGSLAGGTTETREMMLTRDQIVTELRSRNADVVVVPDYLNLPATIAWINERIQSQDVAVEIHADALLDPTVRGTSVFYIAANDDRKTHAELMLLALLRRVPQLPSRGAKPDTAANVGRLNFCRQIAAPSLLIELGFLSNPDDRLLLQTRRRDLALGLADGLSAWSRAVGTPSGSSATNSPPNPTYPPIALNLNGQGYGERGILVHGNAFIPIDLVDRLGVDLAQTPGIRRILYRNIVYIQAIELRNFNISVNWETPNQIIALRSIVPIHSLQMTRVMGYGILSEVQLMMFLKTHHENALMEFPDIPKLYREEATIEGVNYEIAFCQMCLETNFLRFGAGALAHHHNFARLGAIDAQEAGAIFPSARIGIRAQIQHLKAYGSTEPLVQEQVDPRFSLISRGIATQVQQLGGRWSADLQYGEKILAILRRLYESSGLL